MSDVHCDMSEINHIKACNSPMYVTHLTTDSEMRHKSWHTIRQYVAGTLYKSNCNFVTPSILYVILAVTKVMHQQLLITTDSEMRCKAWQTIRQCVTGTLYKSNCNFITPSILYVILAVTKVIHQQLLICDTLRSGKINNNLLHSRWCITLVTARITYEMDVVMKL